MGHSRTAGSLSRAWRRIGELAYFATEWALLSVIPKGRPGLLRRWLFHAPVWQYRMGMARLLGPYMLLLTTTGRRTGRARVTALDYLPDPEADAYYIMSGWGTKADWYRNLLANPQVQVQVGTRHFACRARPADADTYRRLLVVYRERNPFADRLLKRWLGSPMDQVPLAELAARWPMVELRPSSAAP